MKRKNNRRKHNKNLIILMVFLLLFITTGYAAFQTNLSITAKGNVKERNNLYVSTNGSNINGNGTKAKPYKTVNKAYASAWDNATIWIMDDITVDETIEFNEEKNITLTSEEDEINSLLRGEEDNRLLIITGGEINFTNITLDGQEKEAQYCLLRVTNATVNLNIGTTIQNNISINDSGGGIYLGAGTIMNIDGAKIINNKALGGGGGGILARHATLTINSGEISGNEAKNGGAIFFGDLDGKLTLNDGLITNNKAVTTNGGAISTYGSIVDINGGEISKNSANNNGGAIYVSVGDSNTKSTLTIKNGQIINNTAYSGGAIFIIRGNNYNYIDGIITNNTPDDVKQN